MYHIYDSLCFSFSNYTHMCKGLLLNGRKFYLAVFRLSFEKNISNLFGKCYHDCIFALRRHFQSFTIYQPCEILNTARIPY